MEKFNSAALLNVEIVVIGVTSLVNIYIRTLDLYYFYVQPNSIFETTLGICTRIVPYS